MNLSQPLLAMLSDGHFHSGAVLGEKLGVGRAAIWKQCQHLIALGLEVHAVRGRGYRLVTPIELLNNQQIESILSPLTRDALDAVHVHFDVDSTNAWLLRQPQRHAKVCLAEQQTAGRGRRGREWISPLASNLYLSLGWSFRVDASGLGGLSLAFGVAVKRALAKLGLSQCGLKWPNDIVNQGQKLGGILIELRGEVGGSCQMVVGIGLNIDMPKTAAEDIDQAWTDILHCLKQEHGQAPTVFSRNQLAAVMIDELVATCRACDEGNLNAYLEEWQLANVHAGQKVTLHTPDGKQVHGLMQGIDDNGALLLVREGAVKRFSCGEVSLREPTR